MQRLLACLALSFLGCSAGPATSSHSDSPYNEIGWVGIVPLDLTTGLPSDVAIRISFTAIKADRAIVRSLETLTLSTLGENLAIPLRLERVKAGWVDSAGFEGVPEVVLRPAEPLAEGWYQVLIGGPGDNPWIPDLHLNELKAFGDGKFGTRFRVGPALVVRSIVFCPTASQPDHKIVIQFSDWAALASGAVLQDAVQVSDLRGDRLFCQHEADLYPEITTSRLNNGEATPNWDLVCGYLPATIVIGITDRVRSITGDPVTSPQPWPSAPLSAASAPSGLSAVITWRDLPVIRGCFWWTP